MIRPALDRMRFSGSRYFRELENFSVFLRRNSMGSHDGRPPESLNVQRPKTSPNACMIQHRTCRRIDKEQRERTKVRTTACFPKVPRRVWPRRYLPGAVMAAYGYMPSFEADVEGINTVGRRHNPGGGPIATSYGTPGTYWGPRTRCGSVAAPGHVRYPLLPPLWDKHRRTEQMA